MTTDMIKLEQEARSKLTRSQQRLAAELVSANCTWMDPFTAHEFTMEFLSLVAGTDDETCEKMRNGLIYGA